MRHQHPKEQRRIAAAAAVAHQAVPRSTGVTTPDRVCEHALALLARTGYPGEVITLAAEWLPAAVPALNLDLPASPTSLPGARHALTEWLSQLDPQVQDRDAVQLAAAEILTNAIEHAYPPGQPGRVRLQAVLGDDGRLECRITDRGTWKVPDPNERGRGAGLMVVGRIIDQIEVRHPPQRPDAPSGARGTAVILRHRLRRPASLVPGASAPVTLTAAGPRFEVDSGADASGVWARVCGPVDLSEAGSLRGQLLTGCRGGTLPLTVDLSRVSYLGSAGVRALYQVRQQLAVYQQPLTLLATTGSPAQVALTLAQLPHSAPAGK